MSIGLSNIGGSAAGTALAQLRGSDVERAQQETSARELRVAGDEKAESAAGVGQTDGDDHQTAERDADGRLPWRWPKREQREPGETPPAPPDPSSDSGHLLDLTG